ncbi:hypothetical protein QBC36DRAFT_341108 [Triangularia setosa]|uniref:Uncharacterized protein n=1 Tax=Triangularia setosa TaxID=2587417 RepID=A0AAN7A3C7_9PEZI|nr:hypothetical protein QBC36DRAFT_341108 [Podospora setosa]
MNANERAAKILDDALKRYPKNALLSKKDFTRACKFLEMVFIPDVLGDTKKRQCFQQLKHEILPAVGVLLKWKDITDHAISTLKAFCLIASEHIKVLCWHTNLELWQACLGIPTSDTAYLKFRKVAVDKVRPPLVQALPSSNSTQPITISSLLQGGCVSTRRSPDGESSNPPGITSTIAPVLPLAVRTAPEDYTPANAPLAVTCQPPAAWVTANDTVNCEL